MEINTSVQLGLEQALKSLVPYLQSLTDSEGIWDFLDVFPPPSAGADFLYLAGHEASDLPDKTPAYLAFIAGLPDLRAIGPRYPQVTVRMELATAGIGDKETRDAAVITHSQRVAALIKLFSPIYRNTLRAALSPPVAAPDNRPWKGLGFDAWNAEPPTDGRSPSGNAFVANPSYIFTIHFESQPAV